MVRSISTRNIYVGYGKKKILFPQKITLSDIKKFEDEYRHSAEELSDLKQAYIESEGDMNHILDNVLCCTFEDEDRFSNQIKDWIEDGEVKRYLDRYKIYIYIVATNSRQRWQKKKCFFFF